MAYNIELSQFGSHIYVDDATRHINIRRNSGENVGINSDIPRSKVDIRGNAIISGVVTASSFYGDGSTLTGIISVADTQFVNVTGLGTISSLRVTSGSLLNGITTTSELRTTNLNVSGISTLGTVTISSGIVTATSGIVTYYGDGRYLQNVISGVGIATAGGGVSYGATIINFLGDFISSATVSSGIATVNFNSIGNGMLDINNSGIVISGVVTATKFVGDGSSLTNVVSGVDLRKNGVSVGTGITIINVSGGTLAISPASSGIATITSSAAGSDNQVQYRSSGDFAGSSNLTFNGTNLTVGTAVTLGSSSITVGSAVAIGSTGIGLNGNTLDNVSIRNYSETLSVLGNTGTASTISLANGNVFSATLTGNCTFTFNTGITTGTSSFTLILTNDATAGRSIVWPASVKWPNSSIPSRTTTANATDIWSFFTPNNGTTWYGNIALYNFT